MKLLAFFTQIGEQAFQPRGESVFSQPLKERKALRSAGALVDDGRTPTTIGGSPGASHATSR